MGLNIKNERTHALVRELAARTGMSQTSAVEDAVVRRLAELDRTSDSASERSARAALIVGDIHRSLTAEERASIRRAESDLYDEAGLPR